MKIIYQSTQLIHTEITTNYVSFLFSAVYGYPNPVGRKHLWDLIRNISQSVNGKWILTGDFNSFLSPSHKSRPVAATRTQYVDFSDCVADCGLLNLPHRGPAFTWHHGSTRECLDRALGNGDWFVAFLNCFIDHLPRMKSDHNSLLLCLGDATMRGVF